MSIPLWSRVSCFSVTLIRDITERLFSQRARRKQRGARVASWARPNPRAMRLQRG
ncbi:hypothetical protein APY04_3458 [Hyphomicrobium sulfonivorans]|uniref:Uncharacterized protein n=1 Tax=Hyphomicrobium sulfonivorans TaxID=121290 RepID=A0A109B8U0_HYPSL|nr:hypothetical protein APY04_3458 [Hyphomicrobium sulfonivorans]